jgi:hypothetical protein
MPSAASVVGQGTGAPVNELVAACLREFAREIDADWDAIAAAHPGDPKGQLLAWLRHLSEWVAREAGRGCAMANAAVELPDSDHPGRLVVRQHKSAVRRRLADLCHDAGLNDPDGLAVEVFLLCEGARIASQSLESDEPLIRLPVLLNDLVEQHSQPPRTPRVRQEQMR